MDYRITPEKNLPIISPEERARLKKVVDKILKQNTRPDIRGMSKHEAEAAMEHYQRLLEVQVASQAVKLETQDAISTENIRRVVAEMIKAQGLHKPNLEVKMTLRDFLEKRTDVDLTVIDSKIKRIKDFPELLPKTANNPKGNQTKLYYANDLVSAWGKLKDKIPTLPNLK